MALLSTGIMSGVVGDRPAASAATAGRLYFATDEGKVYRDSGSVWEEMPSASAGSHAAVTLGTDADTVLELTGQALSLDNQDANKVLAGPTTGAAADPTFRALVAADMPAAYITATDVTYDNLNANGDVGTGSDQVAAGDHTHAAGATTHQALAYVEGECAAVVGVMRIPNHFGATATITGVYLDITTAPTGADLTVDVHNSGTTIFTTQTNRPHIDAGANAGNSTTIEVASWADGEYLTVDVDAVGSTVPGSDLTVTIKFTI